MPRRKSTSIFGNRGLLEVLVAVDEAGSTLRAADVLGISQPNVSRAIARLEKIAGTKLFERRPGHRRVSATILGAFAVSRARSILADMQEADDAFNRVRDALDKMG